MKNGINKLFFIYILNEKLWKKISINYSKHSSQLNINNFNNNKVKKIFLFLQIYFDNF